MQLLSFAKRIKKLSNLSRLAKDILGVPSSSAPVERLFSVAGKVFTTERCHLTDGRFEQLMFIRSNNNYTHIHNFDTNRRLSQVTFCNFIYKYIAH